MLANVNDAVTLLTIHMDSAAELLTREGKTAAVDLGMSELGWSYPLSGLKAMWLIKRALRHAIHILWVASAQKFKYKQVNLQHRFEHYGKLIASMDKEYEIASSGELALFLDDPSKGFGFVVRAGFVYDGLGHDITYEDLVRYTTAEG